LSHQIPRVPLEGRPSADDFVRWKAVMAIATSEDLPPLLRMHASAMKPVHLSGQSVEDATTQAMAIRLNGGRAHSQARFVRGLMIQLAMICGKGVGGASKFLQVSKSSIYEALPALLAGHDVAAAIAKGHDVDDEVFASAYPAADLKFGGGPDHDLGDRYVTIYPEAILRAKLLYQCAVSDAAIFLLISMALNATKDQPFFSWINDTNLSRIRERSGLTKTVFKRCWAELFDVGFLTYTPKKRAILLMWRGPEFVYWASRGVITRPSYLPVPGAMKHATLPTYLVDKYVPLRFAKRTPSYIEPLYIYYTPRGAGSKTKTPHSPVSEEWGAYQDNDVTQPDAPTHQVRGPPSSLPTELLVTQAV